MRIHSISYPDINNGLGCRVTIWVAGCSHHCKGCQNRETWPFKSGRPFSSGDKEKLFDILSRDYIKGITFSGGDPLDSLDDTVSLMAEVKKRLPKKDIWLYTGYTLSEIENSDKRKALEYTDVLVDGEFILAQRDITLEFRGSSNQVIYEKKDGKFVKSELNNKEED